MHKQSAHCYLVGFNPRSAGLLPSPCIVNEPVVVELSPQLLRLLTKLTEQMKLTRVAQGT